MEFGVIPTIASLGFLINLILIYNSKQNNKGLISKIYKLFLMSVLLFLSFELLYVMALKYVDNFWLNFFSWRLHWAFGMMCWGSLYFFSYAITNNIKNGSIKNLIMHNLQTKLMFIFYAFTMILAICTPTSSICDYFNPNEIKYMFGGLRFLVGPHILVSLILMFVNYFINRKKVDNNCRFTTAFLLLNSSVFTILSMIYGYVSFFSVASVILAYIVYLTYANPDIELLNEVNKAQADIEKSSKTKTDFLSNMTYEIKTPLNIISNLCENLENMDEHNQEEIKKSVSQITISGGNLLDIVNNVLDISKIETGRSVLMEKEYKIKDIIDDAVDVANAKIGAKPVKLSLQIDQNISSVLYGDSSKLYQAVLNIITNSAKYTEVGKITFTVTSTKGSGEETLLFKVTDTGPGIKEEDQAKLFVKGTRLETAKEGEIDGSGFGLLISKQYIDALGGKIWFTSEYRVGSTFYIEVTQKVIDATPLSVSIAAEKNVQKGDKLDCSKYNILIVDDNKPNVKVIKRLLEKYKFNVQSVQSGQECIFKTKSEEHFDMIFLDHVMPDMDGIETLHVLKGLDGYKLPPIVALTANAISGMKETYLNEGFDEYLSKPINISELDKLINKYFNK